MARTRDEAKAALAAATKYGDLSADRLAKLTEAEREEFGVEVQRYWSGGNDDAARDEAQRNYLLTLATEAAA